MTPARWSVTVHNGTWRRNVPSEYSWPHRKVMGMLTVYRQKFGLEVLRYTTERIVECSPCENPLCHHHYKADIMLVCRPIIIEIHRPRNDELQQEMRKHCLEHDGWIVITIDDATARDFPELVLMKVMDLEQLAQAGVVVMKQELKRPW